MLSRRTPLSVFAPTTTYHKGTVENDLTPKYVGGKLMLPHKDPIESNVVAKFQQSYGVKTHQLTDRHTIHDPSATKLPRSVYEQPDYSGIRRNFATSTTRNDQQVDGLHQRESRYPTTGFHDTGPHPEVRFDPKRNADKVIPTPMAMGGPRSNHRTFNFALGDEQSFTLDHDVPVPEAPHDHRQHTVFTTKAPTTEVARPASRPYVGPSTLKKPEATLRRDGMQHSHVAMGSAVQRAPVHDAAFQLHADDTAPLVTAMQRSGAASVLRQAAQVSLAPDSQRARHDLIAQAMPKQPGAMGRVNLADLEHAMHERAPTREGQYTTQRTDGRTSLRPDESHSIAGWASTQLRSAAPAGGATVLRADDSGPVTGAAGTQLRFGAVPGQASLRTDDAAKLQGAAQVGLRVMANPGSAQLRSDAHAAVAPHTHQLGHSPAELGHTRLVDDYSSAQVGASTHPHRKQAAMGEFVGRADDSAPFGSAQSRVIAAQSAALGRFVAGKLALNITRAQQPSGVSKAAEPGNVQLRPETGFGQFIGNVKAYLKHSFLGDVSSDRSETKNIEPVTVQYRGEQGVPHTREPQRSETKAMGRLGGRPGTEFVTRDSRVTRAGVEFEGRMPGANRPSMVGS